MTRLKVKVDLFKSKIFITILNIKYASEFILNLVAESHFKDKKFLKNSIR